MTLQRTQISLSDDDRRVLDAVARRTGLSMSALVREAIHTAYGRVGDDERVHAAVLDTFDVVDFEASGEMLVDRLRSASRLTAHA